MNLVVPLVVALPLVVAALLAAVGTHLPRVLPDSIAIGTAAAVTGISLLLLLSSGEHPIVYWFGGWRPVAGPEHVLAPGIAFVIDSFAAAEAALAGLAVLATLIFAWRYFEHVRHLFHALMLAFLAGMVGFALSGDLFNIFVFFELMSVAGYALCAYRVEQPDVLQGSLNFAILNSIGAFAMLMGIAMLYGSTGALEPGRYRLRVSPAAPDRPGGRFPHADHGWLPGQSRRGAVSFLAFRCLRGGHRRRRGNLHRGHG